MQRTLIAVLLCAALLLGLSACGRQAEEPSPAPAETPLALPDSGSYAEAYMQYLTVYGALLDEVQRRLDTHNGILKSQYPDSYYMNSNYLMLVYAPFNTAYPALGSGLTGEDTGSALALLRQTFPDAALSMTAPGRWEASYTYIDKTSGEEVNRQGRCVWECDGEQGSFRVRAYVDDALTEFTEFVPQGNDMYALYTMTDLALVRYAAGEITELTHVHRISDPPLETFAGDMRLYSLERQEFFPRGTLSRAALTTDGDAQYLLTLENGQMTYTGKIAQDILTNGSKSGVSWQDIDPIILLQ